MWSFMFSPTIMRIERPCSISTSSTPSSRVKYERISCSLIGVSSRSRIMIERSSIPEGMCSQRMFKSSKIWRTLRPKPTSRFMRYLVILMLTNLSSLAIPTTGTVAPLCSRIMRVPGWSGLFVFLITSGILPR